MDLMDDITYDNDDEETFEDKITGILGPPKCNGNDPLSFNSLLSWVSNQNIVLGFNNNGIEIIKNKYSSLGDITLTTLLRIIGLYLIDRMKTPSEMFNEVIIEDIIEKLQEIANEHLSGGVEL